MILIKFSHEYAKFPDGFEESELLDVLPVKLESLSRRFLEYDTTYIDHKAGEIKHYPLPKKGDYLLLLLQSTDANHPGLWTTLRRRTPAKEAYYRGHIGEMCTCKVVIDE